MAAVQSTNRNCPKAASAGLACASASIRRLMPWHFGPAPGCPKATTRKCSPESALSRLPVRWFVRKRAAFPADPAIDRCLGRSILPRTSQPKSRFEGSRSRNTIHEKPSRRSGKRGIQWPQQTIGSSKQKGLGIPQRSRLLNFLLLKAGKSSLVTTD